MKGQALARLTQHSSPNALLDVVDQGGARRTEDRGELDQRKRRAEDRGDAEHLDRLHGKSPELTKDEQSERRRKDELGEFRSALPNLDRPFPRQGVQQLRHIQRVASGALDRLEKRWAGGCSHGFRDQGCDLVGAHALEPDMRTSVGYEVSQQPVELRAPGRGSEGSNQGERQVSKAPAQVAEGEQGRWIGPVKVLERDDRRRGQREPLHQRQDGFQDPEPERRRLGERQPGAFDRVRVPDKQVADLRSFPIRRRGVEVERLHQRPEGPFSLQLRRRPDEGLEPKPSRSVQDLSQKPRLSDPSLALDERDLAWALGGSEEKLGQ
jgi:hypothetical protein